VPKRVHYDRVVSHITNFLRLWRANVEASLIYDLRKVVKYVAKYASKPEKKSNPVNDSFKHILSLVHASADIVCVKDRRKEKKQAKRLGRPIPVIKKVCFITQLYSNSIIINIQKCRKT